MANKFCSGYGGLKGNTPAGINWFSKEFAGSSDGNRLPGVRWGQVVPYPAAGTKTAKFSRGGKSYS